MKKKIGLGIIIIVMIAIIIYFAIPKKYKYICLNIDLGAEEIIIDSYLEECITSNKLAKNIIHKKEELLSNDNHKYYKLKPDIKYNAGDILYKEDFIYYEEPKQVSTEIKLLDELEVMNHGNSSEEFAKYRIYIDDNKLYATNLNNNKTKIIFDKENVKKIAIRPICCAGNGNLIILTTKGNIYYSEKDCNYSFSFDFPFKKINASDIISLKLVPIDDYDNIKNLYGTNSKGENILIDKLN